MRKIKNAIFGISLMLITVLPLQGCFPLVIGVAAGAGGIAYYRGKMEKNIDEKMIVVHDAVLQAMKKLKLYVKSDELNRHDARIKAEYDSGKKIDIKIKALTEEATNISIRIGVLGDQDQSRIILNNILSLL